MRFQQLLGLVSLIAVYSAAQPKPKRSLTCQQSSLATLSTACTAAGGTPPYGYDVLGLLTTWPDGQSRLNASTLNSYTGTVVANAAIVPAGTTRAIQIYVSDQTDVIIDINGYFSQ